MSYLNYFLLILFGVLPSVIWLLFYLKRDVHPEPKGMILKIFFYGMLVTIPAIFIEVLILKLTKNLSFLPAFWLSLLNVFLTVALVEELLKFFVVRQKVFNNPALDEPIDAMIYMIVAGLGFAAGENILILFPSKASFFGEIFGISVFRFLGATFLHALASAIVGFFIGLSFFRKTERKKLILTGLFLAVLLHGFYNLLLMSPNLISFPFGIKIKLETGWKISLVALLLGGAATYVSFCFKKLKGFIKLPESN